MTHVSHITATALALSGGAVFAQQGDVDAGIQAFATHCFSPLLTASRATEVLPNTHDFYDLRPFRASNPVSPPQGRAATPGTDRRCEVSVPGGHVDVARQAVTDALAREGITQQVEVPAAFPATTGTQVIAARQLNPRRIAIVQIGTRETQTGTETFMNVERLVPSKPAN